VRSLAELKRRLHDGRRCFALFHFCLPEDPLVFVHVGLTSQLAHSLTALDIHKNDTTPQCAMFYSINSPHSSLSEFESQVNLNVTFKLCCVSHQVVSIWHLN
jgi:malonyl-CoA decarboxylase